MRHGGDGRSDPPEKAGRDGARGAGRKSALAALALAVPLCLLGPPAAHPPAMAQSPPRPAPAKPGAAVTLVQALVCEEVRDSIPLNPAITFSIASGKVYCFTLFDPVREDSVIFHHWYFRDRPSARIRLTLRQPRWSTFSSIQLREADKGPWRVEITDSTGRVLKVLRFSITD
jgi:hypothetical protein